MICTEFKPIILLQNETIPLRNLIYLHKDGIFSFLVTVFIYPGITADIISAGQSA